FLLDNQHNAPKSPSRSPFSVNFSTPILTNSFLVLFSQYFQIIWIAMENQKEKAEPWLSVPQFGDWDQKGALPDYSMDFSKIRENRKQNKSRASLGNEEDFNSISTNNVKTSHSTPSNDQTYHQKHSPTHTRKSIFSCFNCCVKA
ncbi:hypothetical protein AABB24_030154, partial [Solanum stoloniferum]